MSMNATGYAYGFRSAMPSGLSTMPMTQFMWVKSFSSPDNTPLMGLYNSANVLDQSFFIEDAAGVSIRAMQRTTGGAYVTNGAPTGAWQLVISRHVSSTNHVLRVGGTDYGGTISARSPSGCDRLCIANTGTVGSSVNPDAYIAHCGWVNRDITTQEVTDLEEGGNPRTIFGADLVAYAPMDTSENFTYDPVREINWNNGNLSDTTGRSYIADDPAVDAYSTVNPGAFSLSPLYYGTTLLASKTGIYYRIMSGHTDLNGALIDSGTNGTTNGSGVFVYPGAQNLGDEGDPITLALYWEEGSSPVVDRSLIVKTTLVAA